MSTTDPTSVLPPITASEPAASGSNVVSGWHDQDGVLREMWVRNQTPQAIAEALGRSVPAVMTRAARLGLPRRSAPGRKPGLRQEGDTMTEGGFARVLARAPARQRAPAPASEPAPQTSLRICLMCLKKFESAGRHNRICSTCKNSSEYGTASALPEIPMPVV